MNKEIINEKSIISQNPNLVFSQIDGDVLIMSIENNSYYGLGQIGSLIWNLVEKPCELKTIVASLTEKYDISYSQCLDDVSELLYDLYKGSLIEVDSI